MSISKREYLTWLIFVVVAIVVLFVAGVIVAAAVFREVAEFLESVIVCSNELHALHEAVS